WEKGFEDAAGQEQAPLGWLVRVGDARQVNRLPGHLLRLLPGQLDGVRLGREPLPPLARRPRVLRQECRVTVGAAERAPQVRVAGPVEPAALNESGGRREDRPRRYQLHDRIVYIRF